MESYTKTYIEYFKIHNTAFIACEICGGAANSIHHIVSRRDKKLKNEISNLMAMCQHCHEEYGQKKQYLEMLKDIHKRRMETVDILKDL